MCVCVHDRMVGAMEGWYGRVSCRKRREAYIGARTVVDPRAKCTCIYTSTYIHPSYCSHLIFQTLSPPIHPASHPPRNTIPLSPSYVYILYTPSPPPPCTPSHQPERRTSRSSPANSMRPPRASWDGVAFGHSLARGFRGRAGYEMGWDGRYSHTYIHTYIHITIEGSHASDMRTYLYPSAWIDRSPYEARAWSSLCCLRGLHVVMRAEIARLIALPCLPLRCVRER